MEDRYSIIIPHYKQPDQLKKCLDALKQNGCLKHEVIVVDNNSPNFPKQILQDYKVRFLQTKTSGSPYAARNLGIENATHSLICLLDANCEVRHNLEPGFQMVEEKTIVSGIETYRDKDKMDSWQKFDYLFSLFEDKPPIRSLAAGNLYFTKKSFKHIGAFREVRSGADTIWTEKAYKDGYKLRYCMDAEFYYPFKKRKAFLRKCRRFGRGQIQNKRIKNFPIYFIKNLLPPSPEFIRRFRKLNKREKMNLSIFEIIYFCWIVKIMYALGSFREYRK